MNNLVDVFLKSRNDKNIRIYISEQEFEIVSNNNPNLKNSIVILNSHTDKNVISIYRFNVIFDRFEIIQIPGASSFHKNLRKDPRFKLLDDSQHLKNMLNSIIEKELLSGE